MLSIIEAKTTVATLSAATRKAFSAVPLGNILHGAIFRDGVTNETTIRPSDIRMSSATALTALGGKMSPQSFILGLTFAAVRFAHGNQIDASGLPAGSMTALNASLSLIKKGAGIGALSLETAVTAGIKALLALPAPVAKKKPAALPVTVTTTMPENLNRLTLRAGIARRSESAVNDCDDAGNFNPHHARALVAYSSRAAAAQAAAQAAAKAEAAKADDLAAKAAKFERDAESSAAALIASVTARRDAQEIARSIAESLGFRLVRIPAKKSA